MRDNQVVSKQQEDLAFLLPMEFPRRNHPGKGEEKEKALSQVPLVAGGWGGGRVHLLAEEESRLHLPIPEEGGTEEWGEARPGTEPYGTGSAQSLAVPICPKKITENSGFKNKYNNSTGTPVVVQWLGL